MSQQPITAERFLRRLRESRLLGPEDYSRAEAIAAGAEDGRQMAQALVESGLLTRFQAEMIYRGRTDGFRLGQYRILDRIGRGVMGRVFRAEHETMKRIVALKVLAPDLVKTERARRLFEREVRAAARLHHPNIVTAYDANQAGDRHYLVMEFVDGPNLYDLVKEHGPLPIGQACEFVRQAAVGLQYAFERGLVHRDIKPGNLLVQRGSNREWIVKILDFGLARLHEPEGPIQLEAGDSHISSENQVMGTPDFLAPEQARNPKATDIRSDIYSLGCTLYFLLTGQVPFPGGTVLEKLVRHAKEMPKPIHEIRPDVQAELSAVIARMMAKSPDQRFQTPLEVASALAPFSDAGAGSLPSVDRPHNAAQNASPWALIFEETETGGPSGSPEANILIAPPSQRLRSGTASARRRYGGGASWWLPFIVVGIAGLLGLLFTIVLVVFLYR